MNSFGIWQSAMFGKSLKFTQNFCHYSQTLLFYMLHSFTNCGNILWPLMLAIFHIQRHIFTVIKFQYKNIYLLFHVTLSNWDLRPFTLVFLYVYLIFCC
jgi:hypothetical protein